MGPTPAAKAQEKVQAQGLHSVDDICVFVFKHTALSEDRPTGVARGLYIVCSLLAFTAHLLPFGFACSREEGPHRLLRHGYDSTLARLMQERSTQAIRRDGKKAHELYVRRLAVCPAVMLYDYHSCILSSVFMIIE
jgi:hypothetical protein